LIGGLKKGFLCKFSGGKSVVKELKVQYWNPLKDSRRLFREMFQRHIMRILRLQDRRRPVGWFWAASPVELAYVFDIINIFPEQYSAFCASRDKSSELIDAAIEYHYGEFTCDYLKCSVGSVLNSEAAPLGGHCGMKPDFVLDSRMCCYGHRAMSEIFANLYGDVKKFTIDTPYWTLEKVGKVDFLTKIPERIDEDDFEFVVTQLWDFINFLEKLTGDKLDEKRMKEVFEVSEKTSRNLIEIANLVMSKPVPMSQMDYRDFPAVGFFVTAADYALDFTEKSLEIIKERVKRKEGIVEEEKVRLASQGIIPWYSELYKYYEERGVVFPINLYVEGTFYLIEASKPFESLVRRSMLPLNCELDAWAESALRRIKQADVHGAILFENTGCRPISLGLRAFKEMLQQELGVPSIIVEAPQCDSRGMPFERATTKINAFVESLL
jgi:benzoyl-CoA reductase/2-hydroxyglutaryl-CoA dehydratase subunit BcrC/BadD/HgdB